MAKFAEATFATSQFAKTTCAKAGLPRTEFLQQHVLCKTRF